MKCRNCGASINNNAAFCGKCGAPVPAPQTTNNYGYGSSVPKQKKNTVLIVTVIILIAVITASITAICVVIHKNTGRNNETPAVTEQVTQAEPQYVPPVFDIVSASDETTATSSKRNYSPSLTRDGDPATAWSVTGGVGEWIKLSANNVQTVKGIKILNGYNKFSRDYNMWLYYPNRRAKDITISFSDGSEMKFTLQDIFDQQNYYYQPIDFGTVKYTTYIKIRIDSIYPGNKWDDLCISEIVPY